MSLIGFAKADSTLPDAIISVKAARCGRARAASESTQGRSSRMTCAGSAVASSSALMRCRETVMPRVMALMIAARRSASAAGMAWAICAS